ncbi:hypothetical protein CR918_17595 [Stenotrophomonas indicatrix]|nr:hypothetical protein CR918_17595 [Stenotrophomonas indicatrix]
MPAAGRQPQEQQQQQQQKQKQKRVSCGMAGWVRLRGCPRHGCRGQASKDGFTASPATGPTPPSTDSRDLSERCSVLLLMGVDLGRHVDPRHAWMLFNELSKYSISCRWGQIRFPQENGSDPD